MRLRIIVLAALLVAAWPATARAQKPPCSHVRCVAHLRATTRVQHWNVKGAAGEAWLLYLNIYEGNKQLTYRLLPGDCDASYASADVSAALHACGLRGRLDYVSFKAPINLRVEYRYVRR